MKRSFNLFTALVVFTLALFTVSASAQWGVDVKTAIAGGTANIAKSTATATTGTNAYTIDMAVPNSSYIAMLVRFRALGLNDATTSNVVVVCKESLDGSYFNNATRRFSFATDGTNWVNCITNIQLNATAVLRIVSIENYNTNAITNLVIQYTGKNGI